MVDIKVVVCGMIGGKLKDSSSFTLQEGTTILGLLNQLQMKEEEIIYPLINGQRVHKEYSLKDGDFLTLLPSFREGDFPREDWSKAVAIRTSRRDYVKKTLPEDLLRYLHQLAAQLEIKGSRIEVVERGGEEIFTGLIGSYGKVRGADTYSAFIGHKQDPNYLEKTGYIGQAFILSLTSLGLGSCWMAGFFHRTKVIEQLKPVRHEEVLCVSPIGYVQKYSFKEQLMRRLIKGDKRKALKDLCTGLERKEWSPWMEEGLELARLAPSALNAQPWRFHVEKNSITISMKGSIRDAYSFKLLDCGIAMLHLELGAKKEGVFGQWEYLPSPQVAQFVVS